MITRIWWQISATRVALFIYLFIWWKLGFNQRWHLTSSPLNSESWMNGIVPWPGGFFFFVCVQCFGEWIWLDEVSVFGGCVGRGWGTTCTIQSKYSHQACYITCILLWKIVTLFYNSLGPPSPPPPPPVLAPTPALPPKLTSGETVMKGRCKWFGHLVLKWGWTTTNILWPPRCNDKMRESPYHQSAFPQGKNKLKIIKNPICAFLMWRTCAHKLIQR